MVGVRGAKGIAAVAVVLATFIACRQIVDYRSEPSAAALAATDAGVDSSADASAACGFGYGTSRCASCVSANCCKASAACATNPACAPYASCVAACSGDPACRAQCALEFPPGNSNETPALSACLAAQCESACGLTCGGVTNALSYGGVPPDAATACQNCVATNGCEVARTCGASVDCAAERLCKGVCATFDCAEACANADDAGYPAAIGLASITRGPCAGACARGADWSCVGHRNWPLPKPTADTVTMTIQVKDYTSGSLRSGVDVKVCDRNDVDCTSWLARGVTDTTGIVVLHVPNRVDMGFLGLDGYLQLTSPEIVSDMLYWGFPLSEPDYALTDAPASGWNASLRVFTLEELNQLGSSLGIPYDPSLSLLIALVNDCEFRAAPDVEVKTNPGTPTVKEFYGLSTTETATDPTYFSATFIGVPVGSIEVVATPRALNQPSSRETVNVRAGWVTGVMMAPTPSVP